MISAINIKSRLSSNFKRKYGLLVFRTHSGDKPRHQFLLRMGCHIQKVDRVQGEINIAPTENTTVPYATFPPSDTSNETSACKHN